MYCTWTLVQVLCKKYRTCIVGTIGTSASVDGACYLPRFMYVVVTNYLTKVCLALPLSLSFSSLSLLTHFPPKMKLSFPPS